MFKFIFKSATYILLWSKFKKEIVLVLSSVFVVAISCFIIEDMYLINKSNNESIDNLIYTKWSLIVSIILINII